MTLLNLYSVRVVSGRSGRKGRVLRGLAAFGLCAASGACGVKTVRAQEKPAPPPAAPPLAADAAPVINFRERPKYAADSQRLRRAVTLDGVADENEWEPFYSVTDGTVKGIFYCQWDDNFLYLAAKSDAPASLLFDMDAGGDGWLRGADNLEIVIGGFGEGSVPIVAARLLDAANSKDTPTWRENAIDPKTIVVSSKTVGGSQFTEIAIPKNTGSLVLRPGATIGLRGEFLPPIVPAAYVPTLPFEPHLLLDATLVETKAISVPGVNPRLTISDNKCVAGQNLFGTLELLNQTDQTIPIKAVMWTGTGSSYDAVNTIRDVVVSSLPAGKTQKYKYKTVLPNDLPVGSYTLLVTAEMGGGKQAQSSTTFTVVEPLQTQMSSSPEPVVVGNAPVKCAVEVDVFSAVPNGMKCDIELTTIPAGWELEGNKKRGMEIDREDARRALKFNFKLPSIAAAGSYPLDATVTYRGRVWKTHTVAHVLRAAAPPVPVIPAQP